MHRNPVHVSSLGVGRCFTLPRPAGADADDPAGAASGAREVKVETTILAPAEAWKVAAADGDAGVAAESAAGERRTFAGETLVVEIPRQGFDRLAQRA